MIVDWIFTLLDIASLMFCSMYVVTLLPRSARVTGDRRILCAVRAAAWLVYALLTVMIPTVWQDVAVTMAGITLYYVMAGYLLYHRDRVGTLYPGGFIVSLVYFFCFLLLHKSLDFLTDRFTGQSIVLHFFVICPVISKYLPWKSGLFDLQLFSRKR